MKMTVFDANSPGIPTEKPKGNIELIQVGEQYSIAHIDKMVNEIDPIRVGDIVYSPAWSPKEPMRFALIGKIDVNRDGKDDREDLKRMIQEAGGIVDYDLPPPDLGKESGKLSARIAWYVTDERMPLREVFEARTDAGLAAQAQFESVLARRSRRHGARASGPCPWDVFWRTLATRWALPSWDAPRPSTPRRCYACSSPERKQPSPRSRPTAARPVPSRPVPSLKPKPPSLKPEAAKPEEEPKS